MEQVGVTGAEKGATARLVPDRRGRRAAGRPPGRHAVPRRGAGLPAAASRSAARAAGGHRHEPDRHPRSVLYSAQQLDDGFGYIRTGDGTLLSANVSLPGPVEDGPVPHRGRVLGLRPVQPGRRRPRSAMFPFLGYATVGLNLRGTRCSGGAFDYFETLQSTDGYDVIEMVANQPWAQRRRRHGRHLLHGHQPALRRGQTRPPHLRAITPLSVIDDTFRSTLYPGGILNDGFALRLGRRSAADARPAASRLGAERIADGDTTCADNQALRLQSVDLAPQDRGQPVYLGERRRRAVAARRSSTRSTSRPSSAARSRTSRPAGTGRRC